MRLACGSAAWAEVTFTSDIINSATNLDQEGQDIVVDGCTVTITQQRRSS